MFQLVGNITPTVELNALAMKRGEPTTYIQEPTTLVSSTTTTPIVNGASQISPPGVATAPGTTSTAVPPPNYHSHAQGQYQNYQRGGGNNMYNQRFINYDRRGGFGRGKYDPHVNVEH